MIKTEVKDVTKYLCEEKLKIPIYQRDYSWNEKYWTQLWDDLMNCSNNHRDSYYLGNIIVHDDLIIDGQQRLITIALLSKTLYLLSKKNKKENKETKLKNFNDNFRMMELSYSDKLIFRRIMNANEEIKNKSDKSQISKCYKFFLKKCIVFFNEEHNNKFKKTPEEIFNFLEGFKVCEIKVETEDKPQVVFERLNTASLKLTQTDVIKNFVFMNQDPKKQKNFYDYYWRKIENKIENLDEFFWHYLKTKKCDWIKKDESSKYFKEVYKDINTSDKKWEEMATDILDFIDIYNWIIKKDEYEEDKSINKELKKLNMLGWTTHYPFLMGVFFDYSKEKTYVTSKKELLEIIKIIENLFFRMKVTGTRSNRTNRFFPTLLRQIINQLNNKKNGNLVRFNDILIALLLNTSKNKAPLFPSNEEFEDAYINRKYYKNNKDPEIILKIIAYDFFDKNLIDIDHQEITIEHIMPRTPTIKWEEELGQNYKKIHERWVNTLGNLALTIRRRNSELYNKVFSKKQEIDYKKNIFCKIDDLGLENKWNENTIQERANYFYNEALKTHPELQTQYILKISESSSKKENYKKNNELSEYNISYHLNKKPQKIRDLFLQLRKNILNLDDMIIEKFNKKYVVYKFSRPFLSIILWNNKINIFFNNKKGEITWNDPYDMIENYETRFHWGTGDYCVHVTEEKDINKAINLIKQCYNYHK